MFAKERINEIIEFLKLNQSVTVSKLAEKFNVSEVTIRKDLTILENDDLIERSYGGAIWKNHSISTEINNKVKMVTQLDEKIKVTKNAISEIDDGDVIYLDAGTTNNVLCDYLNRFASLTILTNDLQIAIKVSELNAFRIIFIGGEVSNISQASVDYMAAKNLAEYNIDLAIIGCDSFSIRDGACTTSVDKATIKQTAMKIASRNILVTTSDKFYRRGLVKFSMLSSFDKIFTDKIENEELINDEDIEIKFCD